MRVQYAEMHSAILDLSMSFVQQIKRQAPPRGGGVRNGLEEEEEEDARGDITVGRCRLALG